MVTGERRTERIAFRARPSEKELAERVAQREDRPVGDVVRRAFLRGLTEERREPGQETPA